MQEVNGPRPECGVRERQLTTLEGVCFNLSNKSVSPGSQFIAEFHPKFLPVLSDISFSSRYLTWRWPGLPRRRPHSLRIHRPGGRLQLSRRRQPDLPRARRRWLLCDEPSLRPDAPFPWACCLGQSLLANVQVEFKRIASTSCIGASTTHPAGSLVGLRILLVITTWEVGKSSRCCRQPWWLKLRSKTQYLTWFFPADA
jgi:hypothetical protein